MSEHKVKIEAKTAEEFKSIEDRLAKLPKSIYDQIDMARNGSVGLECNIDYKYENSRKVYLPHTTTQITPFESSTSTPYIGIYAGDYFFKLNGKLATDCSITYVIEQEPKPFI